MNYLSADPLMIRADELEEQTAELFDQMSEEGVRIDVDKVKKVKEELKDLIRKVDLALAPLGILNPSSPAQVKKFIVLKLEEDAGRPLPAEVTSAIKTGAVQIKEYAQDLNVPELAYVAEYRSLKKALGEAKTMESYGNRFKFKWNVDHEPTSGRKYSSPNITNITPKVRSSIVPDEGNIFAYADFNALQAILLADLAGEDDIIEVYNRAEDMYLYLAKEVFSKENVSKEDRKKLKTLFLAKFFGYGVSSIAKDLNVTVDEAYSLIRKMDKRFPKMKSFFDRLKSQIETQGYTEAIGGRRLTLNDPRIVDYKDYKKVNTLINHVAQGGETSILLDTLLRVKKDSYLRDKRLVATFHDGILFEIPDTPEDKDKFLTAIKKAMGRQLIKAKLQIKVKFGPDLASVQN